jgi:hypothetical protein
MKHKLITIITLIVLIITAIICSKKSTADYYNLDITSNVHQVTKAVELVDINTDHNQVLDVAEYMKNNKIKIPSTLINFDTHSDILLNAKILQIKESSVATWINNILARYPEINEVYWVMPIELATNTGLQGIFASNDLKYLDTPQTFFGNSTNDKINLFHFVFNPLTKKAYEQELLVDPTTGMINENTTDEELIKKLFGKDKSKLRKIKLVTCTEKTLPDLKNKDFLLSIDADYVSNSGYDTIDDYRFVKNSAGVNATFYSIFETLKNKNAQPRIITLSLSPQYLPESHHEFVNEIFGHILYVSNKTDKIIQYKNKYLPPEYFESEMEKAGI